ncbi:MAG TPA: TIGR01212 family radical SAM protein [Chroococcales cyanobacterium]
MVELSVQPKINSGEAAEKRYRTFTDYLRQEFAAPAEEKPGTTRVYRVPIDAGFTCPNRDGSRAFGGCTFCDDRGSGAPTIDQRLLVEEQLRTGIARVRKRFKANKFLAYFQAFTNTYAPEAVLKSLYDTALAHEEVVGLCIGTRPDCLPDNVLDLLAEYARKTYVLVEVGLQTAVNRTLETINRGHSAEEFFDAVERAHKRKLRLATHLIFGLPDESEAEMMSTVRKVAATEALGVMGVKIHQLCIYRGTPMEADYNQGRLPLLGEERYVRLVCDALELLSPRQTIMRLVAEGTRDEVVAPDWSFDKQRILSAIDDELSRRNSRQGMRFGQ